MRHEGYQRLEDRVCDGVLVANIYRKAAYCHRTNGCNYDFLFYCERMDPDEVYALCKKLFKEGEGHIRYDGTIATFAADHDFVAEILCSRDGEKEFCEEGCNWRYAVREGNDE